MAAQADNFAPALATKLINKYGITGTFDIVGSKEWAIPDGIPVSTEETTATATVSPPVKVTNQMKIPDGSLMNSSISYMKGSEPFAPYVGQRLTLNAEKWTIKRVDPLVSGASTAAYRLWLSK